MIDRQEGGSLFVQLLSHAATGEQLAPALRTRIEDLRELFAALDKTRGDEWKKLLESVLVAIKNHDEWTGQLRYMAGLFLTHLWQRPRPADST